MSPRFATDLNPSDSRSRGGRTEVAELLPSLADAIDDVLNDTEAPRVTLRGRRRIPGLQDGRRAY